MTALAFRDVKGSDLEVHEVDDNLRELRAERPSKSGDGHDR